jgi:magnesium transporter
MMTRVTSITTSGCSEAKITDITRLLAARRGLVWVDMLGPTPDDLRLLEEVFHFHPLAIEDTTNFKQHPKLEHYPDFLFVIVNTIDIETGELRYHEVDVFVGKNYIVTIHAHSQPTLDTAFERIQREAAAAPLSPGYLLYTLMDSIIDGYFPVLDTISEQIERLEDQILENPRRESLAELFTMRRSLINLWRVVWPERDMVSVLSHRTTRFMDQEEIQPYLRDLFDHLLWIADMVNTFRDTATSIMDLYMSAVSNRLNRVVNRLTVFTVVIGAMAVITGFYGMNFERTWPPFGAGWGVLFVLGLIAVAIMVLVGVVRRDDGL